MTPYRERAPAAAEEANKPQVELEPPPRAVVVRKPGTPLAIWVLLIAVTMALVVSQLHLR